ncbi:penicillin-binding protein [Luteitalea sp. TBR-22]|uniref:penicillin-binding protein 1A n=1 Tax=Luteitalea sp. TBR-22 TaxID=2802971 RepID=UPI001AF6A515|nr:PBP1A family penicillin-binding protein [Luteitalea sp. TBR-22]BCS34742.1 penicillin-binding protein [Luteitalea sp. TBR-22]
MAIATRFLAWLDGQHPGRAGRWLQGRPRTLAWMLAGLSLAAWVAFAGVLAFAWDIRRSLPDRRALSSVGDMAQATTLYDQADEPVFTIFKEQRIEVPLDKIGKTMREAVVSVEDQRFYQHNGVDFVRIGAAVVANARAGSRAQGGSTITQQLARMSFLNRKKTYTRKIKEAFAALLIERTYSKDEILALYLNKAYFGDGYHGVEAASLGFLGKHADQLDVPEAALIAGLIQSPSAYAPTINMEKAIARRNIVLLMMLDNGVIDRAAYDKAKRARVRLENRLRRDEPYGLYFKEQVRRELVDRFGWQRVSEGGLKVYTTIDRALQQQAEAIVERRLSEVEKRRGYPHTPRAKITVDEDVAPPYLQGAVVVMDARTGAVRAQVGGRNFRESRFNRAVQARRQSGSAFKPIVYAAAIEQGQSPGSLVTNLNDPINTPQGDYVPEDEHSGANSMTLRTALRTSSNRAAVQLLRTVGIPQAVKTAQALSLGQMPAVPSMALGAGEVTLQSLTAAYATFAAEGVMHEPYLIRRVEDQDGNVLYATEAKERRVFKPETAFLVTSMLADVINSGTGWRARAEGFRLPAAGKTGTTNDYHDVWFVGFTPTTVTGVWMGFDQPREIIANGYAGELAVPLWASVMAVATDGDAPESFKRPPGIVGATICRISGKRAVEGCSQVPVEGEDGAVEIRSMAYTEYFRKGTEPQGECEEHQGASFLDKLAGFFGKDNDVKPVSAEQAGLPPASIPRDIPTPAEREEAAEAPGRAAEARADAREEAPKAAEAPREEKKRGFWGRLFGRRDKDEPKKKNE